MNEMNLEDLDARKSILFRKEREYLEEKRKHWPFIDLIEKNRTKINIAYLHTRDSIAKHVYIKNQTDEQFIAHLDYAITFIYDFNFQIKNALSKSEDESYDQLWESVGIDLNSLVMTCRKYSSFPKNTESITPVIQSYIDNPAIQSNHMDRLLIDYLSFLQLTSTVNTIYLFGVISQPSFLEKIFNRNYKNSNPLVNDQIFSLYQVYIQSTDYMFHPNITYELAVEIRKKGDYYERIFFDLLDAQKYRRNNELRVLEMFK